MARFVTVVALLASCAFASRITASRRTEEDSPIIILQLGESKHDALVPGLVPPPGHTFRLRNQERATPFDHNYRWSLQSVQSPTDFQTLLQPIAQLHGSFLSHSFGRRRIEVKDINGRPVFDIVHSKNRFVPYPFARRWSFRVLPPGGTSNADAFFTINRDVWGRGFLWLKDEWKVYRGRERDNDLLYYADGSYLGFEYTFWKNLEREGVRAGMMEQDIDLAAVVPVNYLPDKFTLVVNEGEDAALLLTVATIIDMVKDAGVKFSQLADLSDTALDLLEEK